MKKILLGVGITLVLIVSGIFVAGAIAKNNLRAKYQPIGQMVDVGGYKMHLYCQGNGGPTVVLDTGNGGLALAWNLVQPEIAKTTRVCAYDRAGYGWSDVSTKPRTPSVMAEELDLAFAKAGIAPPYILVGHSYGGLVNRQYAAKYPGKVAGMVLVDSAHEEQFTRYPQAIQEIFNSVLASFRLPALLNASGILALNPALAGVDVRYPEPARDMMASLIAGNPNHIATMLAELDGIRQTRQPAPATLGNLPLVVLSHGRLDPDALPPNTPAEVKEQYEQSWQLFQKELAALSKNSKHIVVKESGHNIQVDAPSTVIDAIRDVFEATGK